MISPWNFPLAIPLGMTAAALATGNAVVLKPAEQSPGCAADRSSQALREAGVPPEALALLPGEGDVGAALVRDPRVHTIAFTGSSRSGWRSSRPPPRCRPGQQHLKRVVAEMGGKNCVIVDSDADLDEVVPALVQSAFDYAGQKCSAAARVLVHEAIHDALLERLAGAVEVLEVGQAADLGDRRAAGDRAGARRSASHATPPRRRRRAHRRAGAATCPTAAGSRAPHARRRPAAPTRRCSPRRSSGRCSRVERVRDVDEACDRVDALAVRPHRRPVRPQPRHRRPRRSARSPVGNLYVNRAITGAMVARQPFGGNRLSGTGTKAGGPGYLLQFVEPRVVTENTMRHGLVV